MQWQQLAETTTQLIRSIDPDATVIIESEYGGGAYGFGYLVPVNDSKVVYSVHMYYPSGFTFQGVPGEGVALGAVYPGFVDGTFTNIDTLRAYLQPVRDFQLAWNVAIYVGEFSAVRWAAQGTAYYWLLDCIHIFEEWGWDYTYHAFREYNGWSVEYDETYNSPNPVSNTARKTLLMEAFGANVNAYTGAVFNDSQVLPNATSTGTTTGVSSDSSDDGQLVSNKCQCMNARLSYWKRNLDVYYADVDPLIHYEGFGVTEGRSWDCSECATDTTMITDDFSQNCQMAIDQFVATHPLPDGWTDTVYDYWLSVVGDNFWAWHSEKCIIPFEKTCLAARADYYSRYPDIQGAGLDPIFHYVNDGQFEGRTLSTDLCNSGPIYINDTRATCSDAATQFDSQFPATAQIVGMAAETRYFQYYLATGYVWHYEMCIGFVSDGGATTGGSAGSTTSVASSTGSATTVLPTDGFVPASCQCMKARINYWSNNNDVLYADIDPLVHYQNNGHTEGRHWDCSGCSQTPEEFIGDSFSQNCQPAIQAFTAKHPIPSFWTGSPYSFWAATVSDNWWPWHSEQCVVAPQCQCLAARADYLTRYPDIAAINVDPIYHFVYTGRYEGRTLSCNLCASGNIYANDSRVNCAAASAQFDSDFPATAQIASQDAFTRYLNYFLGTGYRWHFELCIDYVSDDGSSSGSGSTTGVVSTTGSTTGIDTTMPNDGTIPPQCQCMEARVAYWINNNDVLFADIDPIVHYTQNGWSQGRGWDCSGCANQPIQFISDDFSQNCQTAIDLFTTRVGGIPSSWTDTPYALWAAFVGDNWWPWHSEHCRIAESAQCLAARADYLSRYPDVDGVNKDPVYHYTNYGIFEGRTWNSDLCASNPIYINDSRAQCDTAAVQFDTDFPAPAQIGSQSAWQRYSNYYLGTGTKWHFELCLDGSSTSAAAITANAATSANAISTSANAASSTSANAASTSTNAASTSTTTSASTSTTTSTSTAHHATSIATSSAHNVATSANAASTSANVATSTVHAATTHNSATTSASATSTAHASTASATTTGGGGYSSVCGVTFAQQLTSSWTTGSTKYTQWLVTINTGAFPLYAVEIAVSTTASSFVPWNIDQQSAIVYTIPAWQYQNGAIPAHSSYVTFGYTVNSASAVTFKLNNDACVIAKPCPLAVSQQVTTSWSALGQTYQSVNLVITNHASTAAANVALHFNFYGGSYLSSLWNLSPATHSPAQTSVNFTCSLFNLAPGQTSFGCGYISQVATNKVQNPSNVVVSIAQAVCL